MRSRTTSWSAPRCSPATATSRAGCTPNVRANYLASPPLVVAYALLGKMTEDITTAPLGIGNGRQAGLPAGRLADQPGDRRGHRAPACRASSSSSATARCSRARSSGRRSRSRPAAPPTAGPTARPMCRTRPISRASRWTRPRSATSSARASWPSWATPSPPTTSARPASIRKASPAGDYLLERQVGQKDFNSYGARRGNHEVMMRGTFANIRIRNEMLSNVEGGMTKHLPSGEQMPIYDAAMRYKAEGVPLVVFGGKEYGTGSLARLGGQGHHAARRQGGDRRKLRAHPPLQPGRHGRAAADRSRRARTARRWA